VKGIEYDAILRKTNERAREGKRSEILLWGGEVSSDKIKRYERNKVKRRMVREQDILHGAGKQLSPLYFDEVLRLRLFG
jgi:hypothetical protein